MEYDKDKVDDVALALLFLTMFKDRGVVRAWKGLDWDVLDRLFEKGYMDDPKGKARSVVMTEEGERRAEELFHRLFVAPAP
jgi:hypothetical protein